MLMVVFMHNDVLRYARASVVQALHSHSMAYLKMS